MREKKSETVPELKLKCEVSSIQTSPESSGPPSPGRQLAQTEEIQPSHSPNLAESDDLFEDGSSHSQSSHNIPSTAFSPDFYKKNFVEKGVLGKGGNGVVLKVEHVMGDDQEWLKKVLLEVQLLQHLTHQNLVSYHYVWLEDYKLTNFGPSVPCVFILQQFCNGGDLQQYVCKPMPTKTNEQLKERMRRRSKGEPEPPEDLGRIRRLGFDEIFSFFRDVSSGLNHLHSNGFIHRDLKPSNCLLHTSGKRRSVLVSDFGEVQMENAARKSTGATGTVSYCAPEVLRRVQPDGAFGNFTAKSDIFSLGMILYFMCFGDLPYVNADNINEENEDLDQLRIEITSWSGFDEGRKLRSDLPDELYKYLKRLLSIDPASRPTAEEVLQNISVNEGSGFEHSSHHTGPPSLFQDLDSSSRISPVDTPSPAASGTASPKPESRFGSTRKKLSTSTLPRSPRTGWLRASPFSSDGRDPSPLSNERFNNRSQESGPNGSSLVLRSQAHLPPQQTNNSQVAPMKPLQIRAPPINRLPTWLISSGSFRALSRAITSAYILKLSKIAIFLFKIFSLSKPCLPAATNPWVAYPLLCLAAWDFAVVSSRVVQQLMRLPFESSIMGLVVIWDAAQNPGTKRPVFEGLPQTSVLIHSTPDARVVLWNAAQLSGSRADGWRRL
ncbi:hypothetical protein GP486_004372 [Trichoglossum hirsutum]|uniref:Protein kinase domain-containing protein n=1 Tax=Trichoglossum hirsutum TaxID=265104 RepID=A0A9P8RPT8_9PEZI|nr:hypothetical protein GP486_004372 [Trichoglossum hirsutum]